MTLLPAIRRERLWAVGLPLALGMTVLGLWQALVQVENIPHVILPAPITILHELVTSLPAMAPHMRATGLESLFAFLLAVCFGFVAAVLLVAFPLIFEAIYPNLVVFQILPKIALAPLLYCGLALGPRRGSPTACSSAFSRWHLPR